MTAKTFDVGEVLSAGDVNEYLRAGYWRRIGRVTASSGSPISSATFSSIPNTYKNLRVFFALVTTTGTIDQLCLRFNGDTGSNYDFQRHTGVNEETAAASFNSVTEIALSSLGDDTYTVGEFIVSKLSSSIYAIGKGESNGIPESAPALNSIYSFGFRWNNTSSLITSITLFPETGTFYGTVCLEGSE